MRSSLYAACFSVTLRLSAVSVNNSDTSRRDVITRSSGRQLSCCVKINRATTYIVPYVAPIQLFGCGVFNRVRLRGGGGLFSLYK